MENVVGHVPDFVLEGGQVELAEGLSGYHRGKVAARDVHLAARGDAHPSDRELAMGLEHVVIVVEYGEEVFVGQSEHGVDFFRVVDDIKAELLRVTPVRDAVEAAVQIGVPDHEPAGAFLQGHAGELLDTAEVFVVAAELQTLPGRPSRGRNAGSRR